jgi:hypothetical protein
VKYPRIIVDRPLVWALVICIACWGAAAAVKPYHPRALPYESQVFGFGLDLRDLDLDKEDDAFWLAGREGVYRFDGYEWDTLRWENPVNQVCVTSSGNVLAGTYWGILKVDDDRGGLRPWFPQKDFPIAILHRSALSDGRVWAGTTIGALLFRLMRAQFFMRRLR